MNTKAIKSIFSVLATAALWLLAAQTAQAFTTVNATAANTWLRNNSNGVMFDVRTADEHNGRQPPFGATTPGAIDNTAPASTPTWIAGGVQKMPINVPFWVRSNTATLPEDAAEITTIIENLLVTGVIDFNTRIYLLCRTAYRSWYMGVFMEATSFFNARTGVTSSFSPADGGDLYNIDTDTTPGGVGGMTNWNAVNLPVYRDLGLGNNAPPQVFSKTPFDGASAAANPVDFTVAILEPTTSSAANYSYLTVNRVSLILNGSEAAFSTNDTGTAIWTEYTLSATVPDGPNSWTSSATHAGDTGWSPRALASGLDDRSLDFVTAPTLTVTKLGTGSGTVTSTPAGIDCGATCATSFVLDTTVTLGDTPDAGSLPAVWGGDCDITGAVFMDTGKTCTATFDLVSNDPPVITVLGSNPVDVIEGGTYTDAGATADDAEDGDLTGSIVVGGLPIDTSVLGPHTVIYEVTDSGGLTTQVTRTVNVIFNEPPTLTLLGTTPVDVLQGTTYFDAGAMADDPEDGDLTGSIVVVGLPIDTSVVGPNTVTYSVTDSGGKSSPQITRTVNVVPNNIPVITLLGTSPVDVPQGGAYVDAGATADDAEDGDLTGSIVVAGLPIDTSVLGSYTVTYDVTDSNGNAALQVTRTVNVVTNPLVVITLLGTNPVDVIEGGTYTDAGATAYDAQDGDLTASIVVGGLPIDTSVVGPNTVTYDVADSNGNTAVQVTRTVNVIFNYPPVITLLGVNPVEVLQCSTYTDAGATADDVEDGDLTASIVVGGWPIDTCVPGTYTVIYDVTDSNGKSALQVTRTVVVVPNIPVITLLGTSPVEILEGQCDTYTDVGATATDVEDGDLTASIVVGGWPIVPCVPGTYTVTYDVTDSDGNAAEQVTKTVIVVPNIPVIILLGASPVDVMQGYTYTDAGATADDFEDGNITASIVVAGLPIDTSVLGTYTVTYDVTDSDGNAALQVTRTVNVVSNNPPVIIFPPSCPFPREIIQCEPLPEVCVTASDVEDGDLTDSIVVIGLPIDTCVVGAYTVTYEVTDSDGNAAQLTQTLNVIFNNPPTIVLVGADPVNVALGDTYTDAGATASDEEDGDLTARIVTVNPVNTNVAGTYTVTYDVTDIRGGKSATQVTRTVTVADAGQPDIGVSSVALNFGRVRVGRAAVRTVTISNDGDGDLAIGGIGGLNSPFSIRNDDCSNETVAPGDSCTLQVRFAPGAVGFFNDSFSIPSNDADEPSVTVTVRGRGVRMMMMGG